MPVLGVVATTTITNHRHRRPRNLLPELPVVVAMVGLERLVLLLVRTAAAVTTTIAEVVVVIP